MARTKSEEEIVKSERVPFPTKGKIKVTNVQCHVGVSLKSNNSGGVVMGINAEKHKVEMELHPSGVVVRYGEGKQGKIIPYPNLQAIDVEFEG